MAEYKGSCLCGAVKFSVDIDKKEADQCNCVMCRKWCAGPSFMVHGSQRPEVSDEGAMGLYDSSDYGQRCFCKTCGSNLFWMHKAAPFYGIAVDALEGAEDFSLAGEIFTDQKPGYYTPSEKTKHLTAAQFWEMVKSQGSS